MRKCSHLKCTGVRKKENDFIFKATEVWGKVLKNQFIFKGMGQTDYAFVSSIGTVWIQCRCIDFHAYVICLFLIQKICCSQKRDEIWGGRFKVINSTVYLHLLKLFSSEFNKLFVIYYEEYLLKKINFSRGSDLKPLILQLHLQRQFWKWKQGKGEATAQTGSSFNKWSGETIKIYDLTEQEKCFMPVSAYQ